MGGGPPGFPPGSTCPVVLRILPASFHPSPTRLSLSSVGLPRPFGWVPGCFRQSYNPRIAPGLGSSLFARRYFGNRVFFLLLRVLRCFSSPGSLLRTYFFQYGVLGYVCHRVSPFGHLWVNACLRLSRAFRSLPRPSSPLSAKASTECSS